MTLEKQGFILARLKNERKKDDNILQDNKESSVDKASNIASESIKSIDKKIEVNLNNIKYKTRPIHDTFSRKFEEIFYDGNDSINKGKEIENSVKYDIRITSIDNDILDEFISRGDFEGKQDVIRSELIPIILKHHGGEKGGKIESKEKLLGMFIFADLLKEYNDAIITQKGELVSPDHFKDLNQTDKDIAQKKRYETIAHHFRDFGLVDDTSKFDKEGEPNYETAFKSLSHKLKNEKDPNKKMEISQRFVSGFNNAITSTHPDKNFKLSDKDSLRTEKGLNNIISLYLGKDIILSAQEKTKKDDNWAVVVKSANSGQLELFINEATKDYKSDFELAHEELEKEIKAKEKLELQKKEKEKEEEKKKAPEQKPENTDIDNIEEPIKPSPAVGGVFLEDLSKMILVGEKEEKKLNEEFKETNLGKLIQNKKKEIYVSKVDQSNLILFGSGLARVHISGDENRNVTLIVGHGLSAVREVVDPNEVETKAEDLILLATARDVMNFGQVIPGRDEIDKAQQEKKIGIMFALMSKPKEELTNSEMLDPKELERRENAKDSSDAVIGPDFLGTDLTQESISRKRSQLIECGILDPQTGGIRDKNDPIFIEYTEVLESFKRNKDVFRIKSKEDLIRHIWQKGETYDNQTGFVKRYFENTNITELESVKRKKLKEELEKS